MKTIDQLSKMKWLSTRYAYPLVTLTLIVTIALQLAWTTQLFRAQRNQIRQELELLVSEASKNTIYQTIVQGHEQSTRFRQFFLAPEWLNLRQAFDDLKVDDLHSQFHYGINNDSSVINMRLSFLNDASKRIIHHPSVREDGKTAEEAVRIDQNNLLKMDSTVDSQLRHAGITAKNLYALYDYNDDHLLREELATPIKNADYLSKKYTFNLKFLRKYQLIIPSLINIVLYRMRYYLLSSFLMILLTGGAFYLILKLLRNQRLYAEARIAFTSNMTHELKTPVATVSVALESISKYGLINDPEKLQNYLDISRHELQRLNLMIEKVLSLDQMDHGNGNLHPELYDLQAGLAQVISSMNVQVRKQHAQISLLTIPEPLFVHGDPMHLANVFYNLIDNALKYGGSNVLIEVRISQTGDQAVLQFKDTGPGIPSIYHHRIFERFFRIGDNDIHNVEGSGLGLHYVKQMIELHEGRITVASNPGKGSIFTIHLPAYHED